MKSYRGYPAQFHIGSTEEEQAHRRGKVEEMTKEQELKNTIKKAIKVYGYTMISKSWYTGNDKESVLFNAYNEYGECFHFWIDSRYKFASRTALSDVCLHEAQEISNWFFAE